jgi:hypothetical protein
MLFRRFAACQSVVEWKRIGNQIIRRLLVTFDRAIVVVINSLSLSLLFSDLYILEETKFPKLYQKVRQQNDVRS